MCIPKALIRSYSASVASFDDQKTLLKSILNRTNSPNCFTRFVLTLWNMVLGRFHPGRSPPVNSPRSNSHEPNPNPNPNPDPGGNSPGGIDQGGNFQDTWNIYPFIQKLDKTSSTLSFFRSFLFHLRLLCIFFNKKRTTSLRKFNFWLCSSKMRANLFFFDSNL